MYVAKFGMYIPKFGIYIPKLATEIFPRERNIFLGIKELFLLNKLIIALAQSQPSILKLRMFHHLTVKEVDDAVGKTGVMLRMRHHDNGDTVFLVELLEQFHDLLGIL